MAGVGQNPEENTRAEIKALKARVEKLTGAMHALLMFFEGKEGHTARTVLRNARRAMYDGTVDLEASARQAKYAKRQGPRDGECTTTFRSRKKREGA